MSAAEAVASLAKIPTEMLIDMAAHERRPAVAWVIQVALDRRTDKPWWLSFAGFDNPKED